MAYSGSQKTRLGLYGSTRGLYGAFSGKETEAVVLSSGGMLSAKHVRRRMRRSRG